jgi:type II secretory pathway component PulF
VSTQELSPQPRADRHLPVPHGRDLVWFCRRLAAALPGQDSLLAALEAMTSGATRAQQQYITRVRQHLASGEPLSQALFPGGQPAYLWGPLREAERRDTLALAPALSGIADRLEAEAAYPDSPSQAQVYAMALARLGFALSFGVPILTAIESAAASVSDGEVTEVLVAAREAVGEGVGLGEALARLAPDLPPLTAEMIRDGEEEGRLGFALSVVSDYLFDQAGEPAAASSEEVSHG